MVSRPTRRPSRLGIFGVGDPRRSVRRRQPWWLASGLPRRCICPAATAARCGYYLAVTLRCRVLTLEPPVAVPAVTDADRAPANRSPSPAARTRDTGAPG